MLYPHILKVRCRSSKGLHKPGTIGTYLSTADGYGTFFPEGGGVVTKMPQSSVARTVLTKKRVVRKVVAEPPAKLVRKIRRVKRIARRKA